MLEVFVEVCEWLRKRKVDICCLQEVKWERTKSLICWCQGQEI